MPFIFICFIACNPGASSENENMSITETDGSSFKNALDKILISYYKLRDALVAGDVDGASKAANELALLAETHAVNVGEAMMNNGKKAEKSDYAAAHPFLISTESEARGLAGEKDIEAQRKSFQMITFNLHDVVQLIGYDNSKVYLLHCPMAFNNSGADWLSADTEIKNPYYGSKMLKCGFVKDSLGIR